jgi:iron complex transport system ATP-binding protein
MSGLRLADISVAYEDVLALRGLTTTVPEGTWLALIGPNGAGKTTVIRAIAGLVTHSGLIEVRGSVVSGSRARALSRAVAYVPQRPVIPEAMRVADYVLLGRTPHIPYLSTEGTRDLMAVEAVLRSLELRSLADRTLSSLSGGEVQRAVLGRALAQQASVLLLDEPTAALDVGHQQQVLELVDRIRVDRGLTIVSAMHDLTLAGQFADRLLLLARGRAVAEGRPEQVLTEPILREQYGAAVRVLDDGRGGVVVVPTREIRVAPEEART